MNVNDFFDLVQKTNWKNNIRTDVEKTLDERLEMLITNKEAIIESIVKHLESLEALKIEEREEYVYSTYKKWLNKFIAQSISEAIDEL